MDIRIIDQRGETHEFRQSPTFHINREEKIVGVWGGGSNTGMDDCYVRLFFNPTAIYIDDMPRKDVQEMIRYGTP